MQNVKKDEWLLPSALIGVALIARIIYVGTHNFLYDDAYITLRYAGNLIHGNGYAYNAGEPVFGASSPLHTLLLAGFALVVSKETLPFVAQWIGSVCLFVLVIVLWRYLPLSRIGKAISAVGLLSAPRIFYSSTGGMEECLVLMLMGFSAVALVQKARVWQGIIWGVLFVTKVDTLGWVVCLLAASTLIEKRFPWRESLIAVVVALPWVLYGYAVFGTILPHTAIAKQIASQRTGIHLYDALLLAVPDAFRGNPWMVAIFAAAGYGSLGGALLIGLKRRDWLFVVFPSYCLVYTAMLFASKTPFPLWHRWTVPLWGSLVICFSYAMDHSLRAVDGSVKEKLWRSVPPVSFFVLILGLATCFLYPRSTSPDPVLSGKLGEWLRDHATPAESVFLEPIGLIGYVSNLYIYDFIGVVSPGVTEARKSSPHSNRWFAEYIRLHKPSYVVFRAQEFRTNMFGFGGDYGDGIFTDAGRAWFEMAYRRVFESTSGPERERLEMFERVHDSAPIPSSFLVQ